MNACGAAIVTGGLLLFAPLLLRGQDVNITPRPKPVPKEEERRPANIHVNANLVLVPVTVNDPLNRPVSGLEKENFRVYDEKILQTITTFAMDDEPIAAGLVFDTSGSMGEKLKRSRMAASVFFKIADPEDEFFLVEFDDQSQDGSAVDQATPAGSKSSLLFHVPTAPRRCWTQSTWRFRRCAGRRRTSERS